LQVGAYTTQANAEKQKAFFEGLGYAVEMISRVKENKSLFLVLVGTYPSAEVAKAQGAEIRAKFHIDSIVTTN
jgi:cell division protein FtsN